MVTMLGIKFGAMGSNSTLASFLELEFVLLRISYLRTNTQAEIELDCEAITRLSAQS